MMGIAIVLFSAGFVLGGLYFWGLWMTLRRLPRWHYPLLGMGLSLVVRLIVLLGLGGLFLRHPIAPPLETILLISLGIWCSRNLLISALLSRARRLHKRASQHPQSSSIR